MHTYRTTFRGADRAVMATSKLHAVNQLRRHLVAAGEITNNIDIRMQVRVKVIA